MSILLTLFLIFVGYFFLVFVGLRLFVPFMGFGKWEAPKNVPEEFTQAVNSLERESGNQEIYLQKVYEFVTNKALHKWKHTRFKAGTQLHRLFVKDLREIWQTNKFLYCTAINYFGFCMLVNSKYFSSQDIRVKHNFLNFVLHQYLQVKVGEQWVDFDPAGAGIRNQPLGTHASFFG